MKKMIYAAIATALVSYLMKRFFGHKESNALNGSAQPGDHHLTDAFSRAKNYANS